MDAFKEIGIVLAAMAILVLGIVRGVHYVESSTCRGFAHASGYETKFVDYNFWSFECLARTADGKWIPTDRLHDVNVEPHQR